MSIVRCIAFDLGAESSRAVECQLDGTRLQGPLELHRFPTRHFTTDGRMQWDLPGLFEGLKTGLRKVASGGEIHSIGIDTWGVDFGLLDGSGQVMFNPTHYRDPCTNGMMEQAIAKVGRDRIFQTTAVQLMQLNTLYQLMALHARSPDALQRSAKLLFMPDLMNYLFTGVATCEASIASTSQMLDARTGKWATDLLESLGLPQHILPDIVPAGTRLGTITPRIQGECGIGPVSVIAPGCHDTASAVAAIPADGEDWCYISSGTWSLMGAELGAPVLTPEAMAHNYTNELGVCGTVRFLKNIMGLWLLQELRRDLQGAEENATLGYESLEAAAEQAPPCVSLVNPDDPVFFSPGDFRRKIADFCRRTDQPVPGSAGQFARCCLDSLALTYRLTLQNLESMLGRKLKTIHVVGGGSRNALLNQMTADACGREVLAGPTEASALGNALVQMLALGHIQSLKHLRELVRSNVQTRRYEPRPGVHWDGAVSRFRKLVS